MKNKCIFDMDGLMVDSELVYYEAYKQVLASYDKELTLDMYKTMIGQTIEGDKQSFLTFYGDDFDADEVVRKGQAIAKEILVSGPPLKEGIKEVLEYVKEHGYTCVVATSTIKSLACKMLEANDLLHYFTYGIFGDEVEHGKPDPEVFLKAARETNKEDCIIFEDSEAGIEAAYQAGIDVICIPDLKYPQKEYEDKTYKTLPSLLNVLSMLENKEDIFA